MKNVFLKIIIIFILFSIFYFLLSSPVSASDINCSCNDANNCYSDGCSRKPKTENNIFDEGRYDSVCAGNTPFTFPGYTSDEYFCSKHQPDCCFDLKKYGDNRLCCWQERYYCHPTLCNGSDNSCGWYWKHHDTLGNNFPITYACGVSSDANTTIPRFNTSPDNLPGFGTTNPTVPPPTSIPPTTRPAQPTTKPSPTTVIIPTAIPTRPANSPTRPPLPNPTQPQNQTQYPTPTSFLQPTNTELPVSIGIDIFKSSITDSIANTKISIIKTAIASKKILDLPKYAGEKIFSLDQQLEMFMNGLIEQIRERIFNRETQSV